MLKKLRIFFISHKDNNYLPHIFHTKRAFLYSFIFLVIKLLLIGFIFFLPAEVFVEQDVLKIKQDQLFTLMNKLRLEKHVNLLTKNELLNQSAQMRAVDMRNNEYFDHLSPQGKDLSYFINQVGYNYKYAGENLAMGFLDMEELLKAWKNSPTHYANLVDTDFKELGLGSVIGYVDNQPVLFMVAHFGSRLNSFNLYQQDNINEELNVNKNSQQIKNRYLKDISELTWQDVGKNKMQLTATVFIKGDVKKASVWTNGYEIKLAYDSIIKAYTGSLIISESSDKFFKEYINPSINIVFKDKTVVNDFINFERIKIVKPGLVDKYVAAKKLLRNNEFILINRGVLIFFFAFFSLFLLINILTHFRKHHQHIVIQTIILLMFLLGLILV